MQCMRLNPVLCAAGLLVVGIGFTPEPEEAASDTSGPAVAELPVELTTAEKSAAGKSVAELIAELDSDDFAVRRDATQALIDRGGPAVEPLFEAARSGSLETNVRAVSILRDIYLHEIAANGEESAIEAAESALEKLTLSGNHSVAGRADFVLNSNDDVREQRALARIKKLGGIVAYETNVERFGAPPNAPDADEKHLKYIGIDGKWKGGDEGLKYIKRLNQLRVLYLIGDVDISEEGLADLEAELPDLMVQTRGQSFLGVSGATDPGGRGCRIHRVEKGSAADKARLQPQDVIVAFDDKPVADFEALIDLIAETQPGDKVEVEVLRNLQEITLEVVMDGWKP